MPEQTDRSLREVEAELANRAAVNRIAENLGFGVLTAGSMYMAAWVLGFPATWRTGTTGEGLKHAKFLDAAFSKSKDKYKTPMMKAVSLRTYVDPASTDPNPKLRSLFTSFSAHPSVRYSHNLAALPWSVIAPMQFSTRLRKAFPALHRWLGRAFLGTSVSLMVGYLIIEIRGLAYNHSSKVPVIKKLGSFTQLPALIFIISGIKAYLSIAVDRDIESHRRWIIRHVASGLWVSLMRIALPPLALFMQKLGVRKLLGDVEGGMVTFLVAGIGSTAATVGSAEMYFHSIDREKELQAEKRALKSSKKQ